MRDFLRTHRLAVGGAAVVLLAGLAWLAFGWFGVHTLFIDDHVDEDLPVFAASLDEPQRSTEADPRTAEPSSTTADEPATDPDPAPEEGTIDEPAEELVAAPEAGTADEPLITVEVAGDFEGLGRYSTRGEAVVLADGSGQRFLRFEDFATDNGPDLNVYLVNSATGDTSDAVDLGDLKGNIGSQNYEIPPEVDLAEYDTVMIWCVRFSVGFGQAALT